MAKSPIPKDPLGPPPAQDGKLLKITLYMKKLPTVSDDFFHAYWAHNHVSPAVANPNFRRKVVRYNQYHITPELRKQAEVFGLPVLEYDGIAEVWVRSLQDWLDAVTDPDLAKQLDGDDLRFLQQPIHVTMGYDHLTLGQPQYFEESKL